MSGSIESSQSWGSADERRPGDRFILPIVQGAPRRMAIGWLSLGLASLVISGLFSVLIVLSRTPYLQGLIPWEDFFHTALVVHVDLSVLVWFLAFAGVLWSLNSTGRGARCDRLALAMAVTGTTIIAVAPLLGAGKPLMSNYIPVLQDPMFLGGLVLLACGFAVLVLRALFFAPPVGRRIGGGGALRFGLNTSVVAAALALLAFSWSYLGIPGYIDGKEYFEVLFWGGGHVLQFTHTQLMLVGWLWLASASGAEPRISPRAVLFLFAWGLCSIFLTPVIYLASDVGSPEHRRLFTWLMEFGGSLAALPLGLAVVLGLLGAGRTPADARPERAALISSVLLFGLGGLIGFLIKGSNVTVPAHYHGCIVAVTLAFMGMTYHLLPRLGFRAPSLRLAHWQPYVYGGGQLLHVLGLAWSGGYGVQRKTAGSAQVLHSFQEIAGMGLMGLGGLIAIAGGLLFLAVVFGSMRRTRTRDVGATPRSLLPARG
jgi:cytochrome c oxidase subunit I